jgi:hypothetical protein
MDAAVATTTSPAAAIATEIVEFLDRSQDDESRNFILLEVHTKGHEATAATKFVGHIDLAQGDDVVHITLQEVRPKRATATVPTSEEAMEALLKKWLTRKFRAARNNKRYKRSVIDLTITDDEEDLTTVPQIAAAAPRSKPANAYKNSKTTSGRRVSRLGLQLMPSRPDKSSNFP